VSGYRIGYERIKILNMRGILFTEPMFRKAASGEKTQTRRIVKPQTKNSYQIVELNCIEDGKEMNYYGFYTKEQYDKLTEQSKADRKYTFMGKEYNRKHFAYPRYRPGEKLYLKEPYKIEIIQGEYTATFGYSSKTINLPETVTDEEILKVQNLMRKSKTGYCNKMFTVKGLHEHMPHFIEITGVRCGRIQDISDEDCIEEGIYKDYIERDFFHCHDMENRYYCIDCEEAGRKRLIKEVLEDRESFGLDNLDDDTIREMLDSCSSGDDCDPHAKTCDICGKGLSLFRNGLNGNFCTSREAYAALIDSINGKGTWESNPFVWIYDFKLTK
jgi:hypothetical protein